MREDWVVLSWGYIGSFNSALDTDPYVLCGCDVNQDYNTEKLNFTSMTQHKAPLLKQAILKTKSSSSSSGPTPLLHFESLDKKNSVAWRWS